MLHRLAALAMCLALPAVQAQTPEAQPPEPTRIEADEIEGVGDLEVTARGQAEIQRGDLTLFGEELRYNEELGLVQGESGVRLQAGPDRFSGERMHYNTFDDTGVVERPSFLLQRERLARGGATRLEILGPNHYRLTDARFTTCQPGQDDWWLEARELELDYENDEGTAARPRLRFFDVPILAFPVASFPLENRRRSGVLTPYYSQTTNRGLEMGLPFYWNIAPERDLTLTPVFMARRGAQLKSHGRYLDRNYDGELRLEVLPEDRLTGESRQGISLLHSHRFLPGLTGQLDYNRVSDDRYFVDLASQVRQVSIGNLPQDGHLTYSGRAGWVPYTAQARVQRFQTLQDPLAPITPPYHRTPQLTLSSTLYELGGIADATVPAEYVNFTHATLMQGTRVALNPVVAAPMLAPGGFVTPRVGLRHVSYDLERTPPGQPERPAVQIPWLSADAGLVFERDARFFGTSLTQTLEPRLFYVYVPYRNQDHIPVFDTALAEFNFPQLFTENRFTGGDRFGDANQATAAITSRFLQPNGLEAFRATIGQRFYFREERVGLTPTTPLRTSLESDVLGSVGGRLFQYWLFDATAQYSRLQQRAERYTMALRYTPRPTQVLNLSYRFNRGLIRQVDVSGQWPVAPGWYAIGRYNYSFLDGRLLEGLGGFEYNAGCWVVRAVVQRVQAAAQVAATGFFLQLEFTGVGQIGTSDVVGLLSRNVPGYAVTNPRDAALAPPGTQRPLPFQPVF